jgi:hypothetical protein
MFQAVAPLLSSNRCLLLAMAKALHEMCRRTQTKIERDGFHRP